VCDNPYLAMATIARTLHPEPTPAPGIHPGAIVDADAEVHPAAAVCPGAVVAAGARVGARSVIASLAYVGEDARLGEDCMLHPGARVLHRCVLGNRVILQAGAVIGSDGFGYVADAQGRRHKIPQVGIVEVGDDVEIGASSTVDRATFGVTRIGAGTKIDNLVQVGHNVVIGRDCVLVSQSGIAGSTVLGDRVLVGPQAGTIDHVRITSDVRLAGRTAVVQPIDTPGDYSGAPATEHKRWLRSVLATYTLPELRRTVKEIERRLARLEPGADAPPPG
jgi:UDP-3-O-[3-hydroxymyristoyl] glucosamine N-acyltransferase